MTRADYAGAGSLLDPVAGTSLPHSRWAWQPKIDGCYVRLSTDRDGRIATMLHRDGHPVSRDNADGLLGLAIGVPDSILLGELEAMTDAGRRARETRGHALVHLFDVARMAGDDVSREPYETRYGWLHRWQAYLECIEPEVARVGVGANGTTRRSAGGRYAQARPRDLRRLPIVPLRRGPGAGEALWREHVEIGGGEGLVAVDLRARLGARGAKRKIKQTDTIDCLVLSVGPRAATLAYRGHPFVVSAAGKVGRELRPGMVVECAHNGWYESGVTPKFARLVRTRPDRVSA